MARLSVHEMIVRWVFIFSLSPPFLRFEPRIRRRRRPRAGAKAMLKVAWKSSAQGDARGTGDDHSFYQTRSPPPPSRRPRPLQNRGDLHFPPALLYLPYLSPPFPSSSLSLFPSLSPPLFSSSPPHLLTSPPLSPSRLSFSFHFVLLPIPFLPTPFPSSPPLSLPPPFHCHLSSILPFPSPFPLPLLRFPIPRPLPLFSWASLLFTL